MTKSTPVTRRRFVAQCGLAAPILLFGTGSRWMDDLKLVHPWGGVGFSAKLDMFTREDFARFIGQNFLVQLDSGQKVKAELIEARSLGSPLAPAPGLAARAPFSIVFRAPGNVLDRQRIYKLEHENLGALEIFLVPIGSDEQGMRCEAVFA